MRVGNKLDVLSNVANNTLGIKKLKPKLVQQDLRRSVAEKKLVKRYEKRRTIRKVQNSSKGNK